MSGFFLVSRAALAANLPRLRPRGFKILLELLVRDPELRKAEVGFEFGERFAGEARRRWGRRSTTSSICWRLRLSARLGGSSSSASWGSAAAVNTALLWLLAEGRPRLLPPCAVLATQGSTLWNFILAERFVFKPTGDDRRRRARLLQFLAVNNVLLLFRGPVLFVFTSVLGVHYLISNLIALMCADDRAIRSRRHVDLGKARGSCRPLAATTFTGLVSVASGRSASRAGAVRRPRARRRGRRGRDDRHRGAGQGAPEDGRGHARSLGPMTRGSGRTASPSTSRAGDAHPGQSVAAPRGAHRCPVHERRRAHSAVALRRARVCARPCSVHRRAVTRRS